MPEAALRDPVAREVVLELIDNELWHELALYNERIRVHGTNQFMRWALQYFQHMMVHQDGPQAGKFIAPAPFHHELTARLEDLLTTSLPFPRSANEIFRDGAKSGYGTVVFVLRGVAVHNKRNVGIGCASKDEMKSRIGTIIHELETNERLKTAYPGLAFAKDAKNQWVKNTDYEIHLANGAVIKAYEAQGKVRGRNINFDRMDLWVLDDPETEDYEYSEILRAKFWHWLQAAVLRGMTRYAPLGWSGTPIGASSLLERARRSPEDTEDPGLGWRGMHVPLAVELDGQGNEIPWSQTPAQVPFAPTSREDLEDLRAAEGQAAVDTLVEAEEREAAKWYRPAWPERFSPLDVARMLSEGDPAVAQQELMLRPVSRRSNPFDIGALDEYAYDYSQVHRAQRSVVTFEGRRLGPLFAHIDSAESTEPSADYTAIPWGALDPQSGKVLLLGLFYGRIEVPDQLEYLREQHEYWGFRQIGHEKSMIERALQQFAKRSAALPLDAVETSSVAGAKERRLRLGAGNYKNAIIVFPADKPVDTNDPKLQGKTIIEVVKSEMKKFPSGKVDALDAIDHLATRILNSRGASTPLPADSVIGGIDDDRMRGILGRF